MEALQRLALVRMLTAAVAFTQPKPVPLQVIGAGLARTGTSTLQVALANLLHGKVHHFENLVASSTQQAGWIALRDGHKDSALLRSLVAGHVAAVDVPTALHYRALLKEFPTAKVVLTVHPRGADGWDNSTMNSIFHVHYDVLNQTWLGKYVQPLKGFHAVGRDVYLDNPYFLRKEEWLQPKVAKRRYERHNAMVRSVVPRKQLLVYSVDQGWEPLCNFLKLPVPAKAFPHLNESAQLRKLGSMISWISMLLPGVATALVVIAWWSFLMPTNRAEKKKS